MSKSETEDDSSDGVECPTCGRSDFKNEHGMRIHHSQSHGESIAGEKVECDYCGTVKYVRPSRLERDHHFCNNDCRSSWQSENMSGENSPLWKNNTAECVYCGESNHVRTARAEQERVFCDQDCYGRWRSEALNGEANPNWRGGSLDSECTNCGESIQLSEHRTERSHNHFCSMSCLGEWRETHHTGENNPNWKGGKEDAVCEHCGEIFLFHQNQLEYGYKARFCSSECWGGWLAEHVSGENHPNWKGGKFPYGEGWTEAKKEQVRERQKRQCAGCGTHESELQQRLSVHHITPARSFDDPEKRNDKSNLVALCQSCHRKWEWMSPLRPQTPYLD